MKFFIKYIACIYHGWHFKPYLCHCQQDQESDVNCVQHRGHSHIMKGCFHTTLASHLVIWIHSHVDARLSLSHPSGLYCYTRFLLTIMTVLSTALCNIHIQHHKDNAIIWSINLISYVIVVDCIVLLCW